VRSAYVRETGVQANRARGAAGEGGGFGLRGHDQGQGRHDSRHRRTATATHAAAGAGPRTPEPRQRIGTHGRGEGGGFINYNSPHPVLLCWGLVCWGRAALRTRRRCRWCVSVRGWRELGRLAAGGRGWGWGVPHRGPLPCPRRDPVRAKGTRLPITCSGAPSARVLLVRAHLPCWLLVAGCLLQLRHGLDEAARDAKSGCKKSH
jgi:hypothetical protein